MKRRVGAAPIVGEDTHYDPEMLKGLLQLADLEALSGVEAPNGVNDLMGTSQDPKSFLDIANVPAFQNIQTQPLRQEIESPLENPNQPGQAYLDSLEAISQLPKMSNQNLPNNPENSQIPTSLGINQGDLPRDSQGKLIDPLEFIRSRVNENPELMDLLPEETKLKLNPQLPAPIPENFMGKLGDAWNRFVDYVENKDGYEFQPKPEQQQTSIPEQQKASIQEENKAAQPSIIPKDQDITPEIVDQYPEKTAKEGAVETAINDPQIMQDLQKLNGLKEIDPEYLERSKMWQKTLTSKIEDLNQEELSLLNKAQTGELTTFDKVAIGIAVAIPILLGLRYGVGAALASAGEGLKGYAEASLKGQKSNQENAKRLSEINDERLKLAEKSIDVDKKLADSIPDKDAREFLKNKQIRNYGDRIGISAGDEDDALWFDAKQLEMSPEGIKKARDYLVQAKDTIGLLDKSNKVLDEVSDILDAVPDNTGVWEAIKSNYGWFTSGGGKNPFGGEPLMIDVVDKNGKVRKVNAFEMLKQKMTALQDVYNKVNLARAALTSNVLDHWSGILGDPKDLHEWFNGQSIQTVRDKTQSLKDFLNEGATSVLVGHGFLRKPLEEKFPGNQIKPLKSEEKVIKDIRSNPQAYLNKVK